LTSSFLVTTPCQATNTADKLSFLVMARSLCVNYSGLIIAIPGMFPQPPQFSDLASHLLKRLLASPDGPLVLPPGYLDDLIKHFEKEDEFGEVSSSFPVCARRYKFHRDTHLFFFIS
jgi:hypothetical protein